MLPVANPILEIVRDPFSEIESDFVPPAALVSGFDGPYRGLTEFRARLTDEMLLNLMEAQSNEINCLKDPGSGRKVDPQELHETRS